MKHKVSSCFSSVLYIYGNARGPGLCQNEYHWRGAYRVAQLVEFL
jgi:hypothetical protein